jgi:hypothetical protein
VLNAIVDSALNVDAQGGVAGTVAVFSQAPRWVSGAGAEDPRRGGTVGRCDGTLARHPRRVRSLPVGRRRAPDLRRHSGPGGRPHPSRHRDERPRHAARHAGVGTIMLAGTTVRPARGQQRALLSA